MIMQAKKQFVKKKDGKTIKVFVDDTTDRSHALHDFVPYPEREGDKERTCEWRWGDLRSGLSKKAVEIGNF